MAKYEGLKIIKSLNDYYENNNNKKSIERDDIPLFSKVEQNIKGFSQYYFEIECYWKFKPQIIFKQ